MLSILSEFATLLFVSVFGGKKARREMSDALQFNNRQMAGLIADQRAFLICMERQSLDFGKALNSDYPNILNQQRTQLGLPRL